MSEIEIPSGGAYFGTDGHLYHISIAGNSVRLRCVQVDDPAHSGRIYTHMPETNVVEIEAQDD